MFFLLKQQKFFSNILHFLKKQKTKKNTKGGIGENENIGNSSTTGGGSSGGGGFLSGKIGGLFSKITQLQGHNTMKLPDDKNPEVSFNYLLNGCACPSFMVLGLGFLFL